MEIENKLLGVINFSEYKMKLQKKTEESEKLPDFFHECINYFDKYEYMVKANQGDSEKENLMWYAN
jgi:hypothetical protein